MLVEGDYASRALAHASLTSGQYQVLYRDSGHWHARVFRLIGRRMIATGTYEFARGLPRQRLINIYVSRRFKELSKDRRALMEALLQES